MHDKYVNKICALEAVFAVQPFRELAHPGSCGKGEKENSLKNSSFPHLSHSLVFSRLVVGGFAFISCQQKALAFVIKMYSV